MGWLGGKEKQNLKTKFIQGVLEHRLPICEAQKRPRESGRGVIIQLAVAKS